MTQIKKITDKQGNDIYLRTHTKAVIDDNGYTAESRLQAMQDEINQAQLEVGAVPSDLIPTENSTNWVTSGAVYDYTHTITTPTSIDLSLISSVNVWRTSNAWTLSYKGKFVPVRPGYYYDITAHAQNASYCCMVKDNSNSPAFATGGYRIEIAANQKITLLAPSDANYLWVSDVATSERLPQSIEEYEIITLADTVDYIKSVETYMPFAIKVGENERVMYTIDNFIMKYKFIEGVEYLCFSTNLGNSWIEVENTFDTKITHAHYFLDGTLLMCTPTTCYWTKDFQTFTESVIYDYNGNVFQPSVEETRFYSIPKYHEKRTIVNNEEWHLWGDYIIITHNPRLWYTNDNGRTIHAAFAFGYSRIDNTVYSARHIHAFEYNPYDGYFYAFTGDAASECHIIKGQYNGGTWSWEHIVTGMLWKLTSPVFFNGYFAAVTDYTDTSLKEKKGLIRCPTNAITEENINYLFKATNAMMGTAALSGYIYDKNGWRVMTTDYAGGSKVLIAKNNYNFGWVNNTENIKLSAFIGPNANGDIYVTYGTMGGGSYSGNEDWLKINVYTFNFTKAMRDAGAKDFFNYRITDI